MSRGVSRGLVAWVLLSGVGILIVLFPDDGPRIISFSERHGPSLQDTIGIVVVLMGWLAFLVPLWRSRADVTHPGMLSTLFLGGAVFLVWSIATDTGSWWMLGAAIMVGGQVAAALSVVRKSEGARR